MNIVFDNIVFSLQKTGGISVVWQELVSRFLEAGNNKITCIEHPKDIKNIFRKMLFIPAECIKKVNPRLLSVSRYLPVRYSCNEPFIFHSSYFRICSNKKAINVTTIHDFTYDYFYKGKRRGAFLHIWQRNYAIKSSDAVVCISENTRKDLLKFVPGTDPEKLCVINNGVSSDYHSIKEKREELKDCLLFVGQRIAYKNGVFFIDAIKDTNYKVVFCGVPLTAGEKKMLNEKLGEGRYVSYSGLANEELNVIYNSCKCLVYPSSYEGFGIPVLEAQAAGCPVIAYNASSIPEVIGSDKTLLMEELTKEELLQKISLLDDEEIRSRVVSAGLENAKKYSWDVIYKQYDKLYWRLLSLK